jgi:hypothetical protein
MSPKGKYGKWLCGKDAIVRINDTLFVHGGLTFPTAKLSLAAINKAVRAEMVAGEGGEMTMSGESPLWDRSLSLDDEKTVAVELKKVLARHGARRIVVGHTVTSDGIQARAGGRLLRIDVGMCSYYGGKPEALVIEKGAAFAVDADGKRRKLPTPPPVATQPAPASRPVGAAAG